MSDFEEHVERWLGAGVLEPPAAERIRAWEQQQDQPPVATKKDEPGVLEAILYIGIVVLGAGIFALIAQQWDELESWARVAATIVPVVLLLGAGLVMMRFSNEAPFDRGAQAAWFASVAMFGGALGVIVTEYGPDPRSGADDRNALLLVATGTAMLALALWAFSAKHAQVIALAGALAFLALATGNWPDDFSEPLAGFMLLVFGVAGLVLAELGWFGPRETTRFAFAVLSAAGPYQAGYGESMELLFELLFFAVAGALLVLGVVRGSFPLVAVGILWLFVGLVTFIFEHFEDRVGAPMALILSGGVLVGAVLVLAFLRSEARRRRFA